MEKRKIIYILIGVFCLFAILAGVYAQVSTGKKDNVIEPNLDIEIEEPKEKTQEEIKTQFASIFNNTFVAGQFDTTNITKLNSEKDIVYEAYDIQEQKENYEVNIHLPVINIKGEVPKKFNNITQDVFANKASEVLGNKTDNKIIYTVTYSSYINEDILSLVIKSTLKEGSNPQRVVVQTYNYNLITGEEVKITDILAKNNIIQSECQNKIDAVVKKAQEEAQVLMQSGYTVYNRDISSDIYLIANVATYFWGENGELYIIFPYGNQNFTSEMDIIFYGEN